MNPYVKTSLKIEWTLSRHQMTNSGMDLKNGECLFIVDSNVNWQCQYRNHCDDFSKAKNSSII